MVALRRVGVAANCIYLLLLFNPYYLFETLKLTLHKNQSMRTFYTSQPSQGILKDIGTINLEEFLFVVALLLSYFNE